MSLRSVLFLSVMGFAFAAHGEGFTSNTDGSVTAPDGLIWYGAIKKDDGTILTMTSAQAMTCCEGPATAGFPGTCPFGNGGISLPTQDEFETLSDQLGSPDAYNPAPVPDLAGNNFWSSTPDTFTQGNEWYYEGGVGDTRNIYSTARYAVRCVGQ
jgi:hypothetical protein